MEKGRLAGLIIGFSLIIIFLFFFMYGDLYVDYFSNSKEEFMPNDEWLIDPLEVKSGGPPKGGIGVDKGIPALAEQNIKFVSGPEADEWIEDNELVGLLIYEGEARIYPLQILVWHEIVNDEINGEPVLVTYCPLCGSVIAYERTVENSKEERVETNFGTSGKLYNSNLIMYDELTDTYWTQIDGLAIHGELIGQELVELNMDTITWREWKASPFFEFESSKVLSQDTGMNRDYGNDPYGNYYEDSFLLFDVEKQDDRVHPKTVIFGIEINGEFKAYKQEDIEEFVFIEDVVGGEAITITKDRKVSGSIIFSNKETKEIIPKERDFWFAWYAFHPETALWEPSKSDEPYSCEIDFCEQYRYSSCPSGCHKQCISSGCSETNENGYRTCTDDCGGQGSCTCKY